MKIARRRKVSSSSSRTWDVGRSHSVHGGKDQLIYQSSATDSLSWHSGITFCVCDHCTESVLRVRGIRQEHFVFSESVG